MDEAEWLACDRAEPMLEFLRGKTSDRKLRLFAVACCHRVLQQMPDERCRAAAEVAERFADGMATEQELRAAADAAFDSADDNSDATGSRSFAVEQGVYFAARTASYAASTNAYEAAVSVARTLFIAIVGAAGDPDENMTARRAAGDAVCEYRRKLLDDLFGNPFRPVSFDLAWRTSTVLSVATAAYDDRILPSGHLNLDRLAVLADALEDAGCDEEQLLAHLRELSPHVRGCWAVDLLLGKE